MYGVLKDSVTNTGDDSELQYVFVAPLNVYSNQPSFVSDSLGLRRSAASRNSQRWEVEAGVAPTSVDSRAANYLAHSIDKGHAVPFYIRMPQVVRPDSVKIPENRTIYTDGPVLEGSVYLDIGGLGLSEMPVGEFIQFSGHEKVYMVVESGDKGQGVKIKPALRTGITGNTLIRHGKQVSMKVFYDTDVQLGIKYRDGVLSDPGTIRFVEAL